jgi:hypothetical protein
MTRLTPSHRDFAGIACGRAENRLIGLVLAAKLPKPAQKKVPSLLPQARKALDAVSNRAFNCGPQSWKPFLHPPTRLLWSADRDPEGQSFTLEEALPDIPHRAFCGIAAASCRTLIPISHTTCYDQPQCSSMIYALETDLCRLFHLPLP